MNVNVQDSTQSQATRNGSSYPDDEISILDLLLVVARNLRLITVTALIFSAFGLLFALTADPEYTASAKLIRESTDQGSAAIGGLAALRGLGINLGGSSEGLAANAYPEILDSREVHLTIAGDTFYFEEFGKRMTLIEYANRSSDTSTMLLGTSDDAGQQRVQSNQRGDAERTKAHSKVEESAIQMVSDLVKSSIDEQTGLMIISATTKDPSLSAALVSRSAEALSERVREIRTEKARQNLEFIRGRFQVADTNLREAEETLARFLDRNNYPQTAQLRTQLERLQRNVSFKSELYGELQRQLTQAEIDLQKTRPVLTVLESPVPPLEPSGPNRILIILLSIGLGVCTGAILAFIRSFFQKHNRSDSDATKLEEIKSHLLLTTFTVSAHRWKRQRAH